ncbi:MAG: hypothetical protein J6L47_00325 [Alphaproteobacteria bacterium]|nr:hypothetical protein [Alphaproteobacteria bacterium]
MNDVLTSLVDKTVQCWGCGLFDRLFQVVSDAAAAAYQQMSTVCIILFCALFSFFVLHAVWQTIKGGTSDPWYEKSVQKVFINAIVCIGLLSMGVVLPRFITTITVEPAAQIATAYTQAMVQQDTISVEDKVDYQPMEMGDSGFYRPQLRDKIILLMKTTITQFQSYMKLGIAVMDRAFSWDALLGIGSFLKHVILFAIGLYLTWGFFKLFFRYCCYFADIIIAMTFFAFFFPLSLMLFAFKGASNVLGWIGKMGQNLGTSQLKNLINAIITLSSAVITYTVIMVIIAKFFSVSGADTTTLMQAITSGQVFADDLNTENLQAMTLASCIILVYVLNYIYGQIPQISKMILSAFGVSEEKSESEQLANDMLHLTSTIWENAKKIGTTIIKGGETGDGKK